MASSSEARAHPQTPKDRYPVTRLDHCQATVWAIDVNYLVTEHLWWNYPTLPHRGSAVWTMLSKLYYSQRGKPTPTERT
jgi:hypothetical protein